MKTKTLESEPLAVATALSVVLCTAPADAAEAIARAVLERRLAACVNIVPGVVSLYWWEGAIQQGGESLLVMKTRRELVDALARAVASVHPYAVPEIIALGVEPGLGNLAYHRWVETETSPRAKG